MMTRTLLILLILQTSSLFGQRLLDFKYSNCDERNPHKYKMQTMVSRLEYSKDSLLFRLIWMDNCAFEPTFEVKGVEGDTLYFSLINKAEDRVFCGCAFTLEFALGKVDKRKYQVKINDILIEKNNKRYKTNGYSVERFPFDQGFPKKYREIYSEDGVVLVETFYNEKGIITGEKFYAEDYGFFIKELKY